MYEKLRPHIGHHVACVCYGPPGQDPVDICIECEDCNEVLVSAETEEYKDEQNAITHCKDCGHCFESRLSKTGYACEVWGYDDFACDTKLDGYCHKAKPKSNR